MHRRARSVDSPPGQRLHDRHIVRRRRLDPLHRLVRRQNRIHAGGAQFVDRLAGVGERPLLAGAAPAGILLGFLQEIGAERGPGLVRVLVESNTEKAEAIQFLWF
jgi:hypothetical protein